MSKDCCKPNNSSSSKKADPFLVGVIVVTVLFLIGVVVMGSKVGVKATASSDENVALAVDSSNYDWGTIDYSGGIVSKNFQIKNEGTSTLKLYNVVTSCMCTTAQLTIGDVKSKKFGMHESSPDIFEVQPGETANLVVEFDPAYHGPSGIGPINRVITISTNDVKNSTLTFNLTGTVVKN